jgi:DNA repair photolyase
MQSRDLGFEPRSLDENHLVKSMRIGLEIREIEAKSMLHKINVPKLPFRWGANPYRGCQHDCWFCYARYTHEYLQLPLGMFQHVVFAKVNAALVLRKELIRRSWKKELVNLGTVTDPYQPIERKYRLTRQMLQVFRECKTPVVITTKSHHILDDLGLLVDFAQDLFLNVVFSVTTMDETLKQKLEPSTCTIKRRFQTVEKLAAVGLTVGVLMSPVFPALTNSREQMAEVARAAANAGASYFLADVLNMRLSARQYFMPYLAKNFPDLVPHYQVLYKGDYLPRKIARAIKAMQREVAAEYGVDHYDRMLYTPPGSEEPQQLPLKGINAL